MLVKESAIREFRDELTGLITAGHHRIALDFRQVERLSSLLIPVIEETSRNCSSHPGGKLKIFGMRSELCDFLKLGSLNIPIEGEADETSAIEGEWPSHDGPPPLPAALLEALRGPKSMSDPEKIEKKPSSNRAGRKYASARLRISEGKFAGRYVSLLKHETIVGRAADCDLRLGTLQVSRHHAILQFRGGRVTVRDAGSTNGTIHNGVVLRNSESHAEHGDRLEIGPYSFVVELQTKRELTDANRHAITNNDANTPSIENDEEVLDWLAVTNSPHPVGKTAEAFRPSDLLDDRHGAALRWEIVQESLVVTLLNSHLEDDPAIDDLRTELAELMERSLPRRVVIDLKHVATISGTAVGVLVAHHFVLTSMGGGLRLCQASPIVGALLDRIHLTVVVDVFPDVDEAVLVTWDQ